MHRTFESSFPSIPFFPSFSRALCTYNVTLLTRVSPSSRSRCESPGKSARVLLWIGRERARGRAISSQRLDRLSAVRAGNARTFREAEHRRDRPDGFRQFLQAKLGRDRSRRLERIREKIDQLLGHGSQNERWPGD